MIYLLCRDPDAVLLLLFGKRAHCQGQRGPGERVRREAPAHHRLLLGDGHVGLHDAGQYARPGAARRALHRRLQHYVYERLGYRVRPDNAHDHQQSHVLGAGQGDKHAVGHVEGQLAERDPLLVPDQPTGGSRDATSRHFLSVCRAERARRPCELLRWYGHRARLLRAVLSVGQGGCVPGRQHDLRGA